MLSSLTITGYTQFQNFFGDITLLTVAEGVLACVFCYIVYKKIKKHLIQNHEATKLRDAQIKEALDATKKYPEYRKQSVQIQQSLNQQIGDLRIELVELSGRLARMEETTQRRERNKLRDRLLQNYRYYTNSQTNPTGTWTSMEAEAFWELFKEYEENGGNGYVHSEVLPAMQKLIVVDVSSKIHLGE